MTYHPPIPTNVPKVQILEFAENLREQTGLKNGFELSDLVKQNEGEISYIDFMDADQVDAITVESGGSFRIRLSSHTGALRDNFTIAHELGHLVLHWPKVQKAHDGDGMRATRKVVAGNERCEWEANWFAAGFLMPEDAFKKVYQDNPKVAADVFGVTLSAAKVRANALGL